MYENITSDNVMMFAIKHYDNPQCESEKEFHDDMKRFKYVKRLLRKYKDHNVLKERLLLNHIIILNNLLGNEACCRILFFKLEEKYHSYLKSFLSYLQYLPYEIPEVELNEVPVDSRIDYMLKMEKY